MTAEEVAGQVLATGRVTPPVIREHEKRRVGHGFRRAKGERPLSKVEPASGGIGDWVILMRCYVGASGSASGRNRYHEARIVREVIDA
jgi:hypothetical protein